MSGPSITAPHGFSESVDALIPFCLKGRKIGAGSEELGLGSDSLGLNPFFIFSHLQGPGQVTILANPQFRLLMSQTSATVDKTYLLQRAFLRIQGHDVYKVLATCQPLCSMLNEG